jgi:hypothetical protein
MVSVVIAIVILPPPVSLIKFIAVPVAKFTLLFAGIVHVLADVSAPG